MDSLFYYTGMGVWALIALGIAVLTLYVMWLYLSMSISFWWVRVEAAELNPKSGTIGREFRAKRFWKARLMWLIATDFKWYLQVNGSNLRGDCWKADYTGFIPRVKAWRFPEHDQ